MSYLGILAWFMGLPLLLLIGWAWRVGRPGKRALVALAIHVALALIYSILWDNYLVATKVWRYDPALVTGITLGYVPLEDYVFFAAQTLLAGLWLLALLYYREQTPLVYPLGLGLRRRSTAIAGLLWLMSLMLLVAEWRPGTYLGLELAWGVAPIIVQLAFGADLLWARRRLVAAGILIPTAYLLIADAVALRSGIWTIDPVQSTGWALGGILPVEDIVFFLITNTMVVFGITLFLADESIQRLKTFRHAAEMLLPARLNKS